MWNVKLIEIHCYTREFIEPVAGDVSCMTVDCHKTFM